MQKFWFIHFIGDFDSSIIDFQKNYAENPRRNIFEKGLLESLKFRADKFTFSKSCPFTLKQHSFIWNKPWYIFQVKYASIIS